ncbi:MAG: riboflavin synthase [Candidatus Sumerlaeia bacterium]|nr:riboflavin synthase [Candidatus Sumerlaeia bacterium]
MFTGIIEEIGTISSINRQGNSIGISIACKTVLEDIKRGDSIAVDGCCLTAESFDKEGFRAYASPETMEKTSLGDRRAGDPVNLERALTLGTRLGGHLVSGHVDDTGHFKSARSVDQSWEVHFSASPEILRQCINKGSIAIDGISLTIAALTNDGFSVWIIPETWERTTLSRKRPKDRVNLETDLIGKYVHRFLETSADSPLEARDAKLINLLSQGSWGKG